MAVYSTKHGERDTLQECNLHSIITEVKPVQTIHHSFVLLPFTHPEGEAYHKVNTFSECQALCITITALPQSRQLYANSYTVTQFPLLLSLLILLLRCLSPHCFKEKTSNLLSNKHHTWRVTVNHILRVDKPCLRSTQWACVVDISCIKSLVIQDEFLFDNCRRIIPSLSGYTDNICKYSRQLRTAFKHSLVLIIPAAPNHTTRHFFFLSFRLLTRTGHARL